VRTSDVSIDAATAALAEVYRGAIPRLMDSGRTEH
jgi:hypothetical protein